MKPYLYIGGESPHGKKDKIHWMIDPGCNGSEMVNDVESMQLVMVRWWRIDTETTRSDIDA